MNVDLRKKEELSVIPKDVDLVVHLAANARVYDLVVDPDLARDNFETLYNILEFCRINNIKKFIFASSREVYGNSGKEKHNEEEAFVKNCESPYTASKIGGEALVHAYHNCYKLDYVILRFPNVYGMYDESDRVVPLFTKNCLAGKDLIVFGENKYLDFTYIDDNISGISSVIQQFEKVKNDTLNLASGNGESILNVAKIVNRVIGKNNKIIVKTNRTGEVIKFVADITKAKKRLGFSPKVSIEEGIKRSVEWYKSNVWNKQ